MSLWKLDRREEARAAYEVAAQQIDKRPDYDEDADRYRAEAARLLGLPVPSTADALPPVAIELSKQFEELRQKLARLDEQPAPPPSDRSGRLKLAQEYLRLGWSSRKAGDLATAEASARSSYSRFVELAREDAPGDRYAFEAGQAADLLCELLRLADRKTEALPLAYKTAGFFQTATQARPATLFLYQDAAANAHRRLGQLLRDVGHVNQADQAERVARAATEKAAELRALPQLDQVLARVRSSIEQRDWKRVAQELDKGVDRQPEADPGRCFQISLIRLLTGDVDGYVRVVEKMPRRSMSHEWPHEVARTLSLHPRGFGDPAILISIAQEAATWNSDPDDAWPHLNLGMAHYRAGQYQPALTHFRDYPGFTDYRVCWPPLAMVYHRLGRPDEARRWLDKAHAHFREITKAGPEALKATMQPYWEDWAYFELLLREVDTLIEGDPRP